MVSISFSGSLWFFFAPYYLVQKFDFMDLTVLVQKYFWKFPSVFLVPCCKSDSQNIIMIKLDGFFRMIHQYIGLAMSLKKIVLGMRLAQFLSKLIARPISLCIILSPSNFISNFV